VNDTPTYFATKYDSAAHEVIAVLADYAEGFGSGFGGDVDCPTGYFQRVTLDESCDLDFTDYTNYRSGDYAGELARTYGVTAKDVMGHHIVTTNDQGFVSVTTYDTAEEADAALAALEAAWSEWMGDDAP
jgi:hypothetical protein